MNFDLAFERLIGHEGGYSNNPADPGGETMFGITKVVAVADGYTGPMSQLKLTQAKDIARRQYWNKVSADKLPPAMAYQVFDAAYNHGVGRAVRLLQAAVGVKADGIIGPMTLAALAELDASKAVMLFCAQRLQFYTELGTWPSFSRGWSRRVVGNLKYAAEDL